MLESQLENYDCLIEEHEKKQISLLKEIENYKKDIDQLQKDIQTAKQGTNEEKSLRLLAEKRTERLQTDLNEIKEEKDTLAVSYKLEH